MRCTMPCEPPAFLFHDGDDFEEHQTLPGKSPDDLPDRAMWSNALKDARERRNAADYDPYPKSDGAWRDIATSLRTEARALSVVIRVYLRSKGCRYL